MEHLWSPWRMEYIQAVKDDEDDGCVLLSDPRRGGVRACPRAVGARLRRAQQVSVQPGSRDGRAEPSRSADFEALADEELLDLQRLVRRSVSALREEMAPHGFNVGAEPRSHRRGGDAGPSPLARGPSMERRHELHAGRRADAGDAGASGGDRRPVDPPVRGRLNRKGRLLCSSYLHSKDMKYKSLLLVTEGIHFTSWNRLEPNGSWRCLVTSWPRADILIASDG